MNDAREVPLIEQLRSVPKDQKVVIEFQWAENGIATGHHSSPVGALMHRAADALEAAQVPEVVERTGGLVAWTDALLIIQRGMDAYKAKHLKWWKWMDGTPILNDLPVMIAEVVSQELHYPPSRSAMNEDRSSG